MKFDGAPTLSFNVRKFVPKFRPPFQGSWGAGCKFFVSNELFQSYRTSVEDAHCLGKPNISPAVTDTRVQSFTGSNFRSAFGKFSKRSKSDRSPSSDRSRSMTPMTARPPTHGRRRSQRVIDPNWFDKNGTSVRSADQNEAGIVDDSLTAWLNQMKSVSAQLNKRDSPDKSQESDENIDSEGQIDSEEEDNILNGRD